jgi:formyltetrahydrofolate-dependent phosphoribosylglycinamide formyltransferase
MFEKLKQHWKVNGLNLALIVTTFALGGSLCGKVSAWILNWLPVETKWIEVLLFVLLCTLLWPLAVLLVSIPLGQFPFFKKYIGKVIKRFTGKPTVHNNKAGLINIAIFASGAGSNAEKIIKSTTPPYIQKMHKNEEKIEEEMVVYRIALIVCNKPDAGVLSIAKKSGIPTLLIEKDQFFNGDSYLPELERRNINFIVLAGFLLKIPDVLIKAYPKKIINIHPALLPKYGGKGMFGQHVHQAVISNKENESGISIHYVDELYDHGEIIFQAKCTVDESDTSKTLAEKIHLLEHKYYPEVIASVLQKQNRS